MTVLHGVPAESNMVQRLRMDLVEMRRRLTADLVLFDAAFMTVEVDEILLEGCVRRLDFALDHPED